MGRLVFCVVNALPESNRFPGSFGALCPVEERVGRRGQAILFYLFLDP
jgi:hypothetical protein